MALGIKEIQEIIPHRYPFLLVDRIEEIEEGKRAVGYKNVTINEYFFQGHFPQEPVMPGVLIIEALAQVGAVALLSMEEYKGKIAYFGGINKAKFRRKVVPGDVIRLEVEMTKMRGPAGFAKAIATVDGKKAAEAELMFMVGDAE
ncbi:3-hydroxyacyl-ACP dehydratase FabZ [Clostridium aestuarii]|uniref:3-hydroxyacyl-[acyl-carrier-protein] dehydratase FabZ n=1 Tax=Clostridium aestuarii TaxID=338193 RepID=A0ABT4D2E2_9CLOT|nr:3-hydroxyacyl-ACP dehydratase FabZ [Clostridium aestuarii]MCY6485277.1 3-hydroxyacyl-ACP dehydratase FabZ [Clostridium aestuarii]